MAQYDGRITIIESERLLFGYVTSVERCLMEKSADPSLDNATNVILDQMK
jgi:hypothetical protein